MPETKAFQKMEKTERNSFTIKHNYVYQLRSIKTGDTMAYYKKSLRSPWFDKTWVPRLVERARRKLPQG